MHRAHFVDDAFISLRYARNLLDGHGLSFNPGDRVEGVTNLGWVLVVAAAGAVAPVPLPAVAKVLGLAALVAAVIQASAAARRLPAASPLETALLPVLLVSTPELVYFSLAGMETGLAALLVAVGTWAVARERPRTTTAAVACGLLFTVRPESLLLFPLFAAAMLVAPGPPVQALRQARGDEEEGERNPAPALRRAQGGKEGGLDIGHRKEGGAGDRRRVGGALALFVAVILAVTLARWAYFGDFLPNTFLAKGPGGAAELLWRGWDVLVGRSVNAPAPFVGSLLLVLGGIGAASLWRRRRAAAAFLAAAAATGLLFAVYAPADWTGMGRYFAPYLPAAAALLVRGAFAGAARVPGLAPASAPGAAAALVLLLAGVGAWRGFHHLSARALGEYPGFVLASETLVPPARWIDRALPPDARIAARRIGALGYFGGRPVLDYALGLTEPAVAYRQALRGRAFERPDADELAPVWADWRPDCVLEDEEILAPLAAGGGWGPIEIHGTAYGEVRRFPLGAGAGEWVLACRPGVVPEISPGGR